LLPGTFLPGVAEGSFARLTEHALIATLTNWTKFEEAGFNLHLAINVPVSVSGCRFRRWSTDIGRNPSVGPASFSR
jgi:hypothetical protein